MNAPTIGKKFSKQRVFPEQEAYERLRPIVLFGETLWTLGPDNWVLYWRTPDPVPARGTRNAHEIIQHVLFDLAEVERAVGAEGVGGPHPWLRVVPKDPPRQTEE